MQYIKNCQPNLSEILACIPNTTQILLVHNFLQHIFLGHTPKDYPPCKNTLLGNLCKRPHQLLNMFHLNTVLHCLYMLHCLGTYIHRDMWYNLLHQRKNICLRHMFFVLFYGYRLGDIHSLLLYKHFVLR